MSDKKPSNFHSVVICSHFENDGCLTLNLSHLALVLVVHPVTVHPDLFLTGTDVMGLSSLL